MNLVNTHEELTSEERVISLYEICKLMGKEHNKAIKLAEEVQSKDGFGRSLKTRATVNRGDRGATQEIETYSYTKKQALMIGARLDSSNIIALVNKLEEVTKPKEMTVSELLKQNTKVIEQLEGKVEVLEETIEKKDEVILAVADLNIRAGDVTIGDFSKNLAIEGLGRNNLFNWLRARNFIMMNTEPYQTYVERGYFVRKPSDKKINGEVRYTTMLTPRGTVWLTKMLKAEYELEDGE
jgi:phage antirepressor YoqD-like protein